MAIFFGENLELADRQRLDVDYAKSGDSQGNAKGGTGQIQTENYFAVSRKIR